MGAGPPCLNSLNECFIVHDVRNIVDFAFLSSDQELSFYCLALIGFFLGGGGGATSYPGFLLSRLDGQRKRPWSRLVCFTTLLVNDFECNYSIYVGIIIILVEREWSDKFIISS